MITAQQSELHRRLRAEGATTREAVEVLLTVEQVGAVELAMGAAAAWRHESRGPHGEWERSSGAAVIHSGDDLRAAAQHEDEIRQIARETALKVSTTQDVSFDERLRKEQADRDRRQTAQIAALTKQVRSANQRISQLAEKQEKRKSRKKSLAVISSLVGGAVLGGVEAKLGVPGMASVASSIAPGVIESLFEWKNRL